MFDSFISTLTNLLWNIAEGNGFTTQVGKMKLAEFISFTQFRSEVKYVVIMLIVMIIAVILVYLINEVIFDK